MNLAIPHKTSTGQSNLIPSGNPGVYLCTPDFRKIGLGNWEIIGGVGIIVGPYLPLKCFKCFDYCCSRNESRGSEESGRTPVCDTFKFAKHLKGGDYSVNP